MTGAPGKNDCDYCGATTGHYHGCPEGVSTFMMREGANEKDAIQQFAGGREVFMPPFKLNPAVPPQHTFDAYVLGSIAQQTKLYSRRNVRTALREALLQAHERGYQIPETFKEFA